MCLIKPLWLLGAQIPAVTGLDAADVRWWYVPLVLLVFVAAMMLVRSFSAGVPALAPFVVMAVGTVLLSSTVETMKCWAVGKPEKVIMGMVFSAWFVVVIVVNRISEDGQSAEKKRRG